MNGTTSSGAGGVALPPGTGVPIVSIDSLCVSYGAHVALRSVTFDLRCGVTGLLGPNGAGKSTLLRVLATARSMDAGEVTIAGLRASDSRHHRQVRRHIGYLPQSPGFYPGFRVEAFVHHVAILKEIAGKAARADEVRRVLTVVDLERQRRERIKNLSGGMRQRLALACAMVGDPEVLVLDEPSVGLDPEQRVRFREVIADVGRRRTVILSTHQTDDVASLCLRVIVLNKGEVLMDGTPRELADCAAGRVWESSERVRDTLATWTTGEGCYRHIGSPQPDGRLVPATLDDGYLVLMASANDPAAVSA